MRQEVKDKIITALHAFTMGVWQTFCREPKLIALYERNLREGRHKYEHDKVTCGYLDCWSMYHDLILRYPAPQKILLDCEEAAGNHAAFLAAKCYKGVWIGFVPGRRVSHAVCGVGASDKAIKIIDPARWYGMGETSYDHAVWRKVA